MTPFPGKPYPGAVVVAWRLDEEINAANWDSGIGAELKGGRWNPKGIRAVYCSIDPAATILESAVHRGFKVLDTKPFVLTRLEIVEPAEIHLVEPKDVPNPAWLHAGIPSAGQQSWGAELLHKHLFVGLPSVVSKFSWNIVFRPDLATGKYTIQGQDRLVLDTRLNPAAP